MPYVNKRVVSQEFFTTSMKGPKGNQGIQGSIGPQGTTGLQGSQGVTGTAGVGVTGLPGIPGSTGLRGLTGLSLSGSTGLQGITGIPGSTGLRGLTGLSLSGSTGLQGVTGIVGSQGVTGPAGGGGSGDGATGPQGVTGLKGEDGEHGMDGSQGVTGLRGIPGLDGNDGSDGSQGVTGLSGTDGGSIPGTVALASQVSITSSTNETDILSYTLPQNSLEVGSTFKFTFYGTHKNTNNSGILTFRMYIGSNAGQTVVLASGSTRAQTFMEFYGMATVRTTGSSGTFISTGIYNIHTSVTAVSKAYQGGNATSTVDTTDAAPVVRITAQWASANPSNSLLIQNAVIERVI